MMRESTTTVIERNVTWRGRFATEPMEAAWASEAICFVRALDARGMPAGISAKVQISPDGIRWCDEGTEFALPVAAGALTFTRVSHFGGWLRVAGELPDDVELRVIAYLVLKS